MLRLLITIFDRVPRESCSYQFQRDVIAAQVTHAADLTAIAVSFVAVHLTTLQQSRPEHISRNAPKRLTGLRGVNASDSHREVLVTAQAPERISVVHGLW
jgi:hypothetical protein